MATGYGEFAKGARQGSMNPQQWNAYLMQQGRVRGAYKQAFSELQTAAQQEGLNIAPPELSNNVSQAEAQAKLQEYAKNVNQNLSYFDVDVQLNTVYKSASASGLSVPRPTVYGKTVKDEATAKVILDNYTHKVSQLALQKGLTDAVNDIRAQAAQQGVTLSGLSPNAYAGLTEARAQYFIDGYLKNANNQIAVKNYNDAINSISAQARAQGVSVAVPTVSVNSANAQTLIDQYASSVNNALLQKSVSGAVDSIYVQAKGYGVEVPKPSLTGVNQANAQSFVDGYLTKVNKALEGKSVTTASKPELQKANINRSVIGPGGQNPSLVASYIVHDDLGREQTITQTQLQQMQKAQASRKSSENFTLVPEEVANSKSNWWINSNGLYEWTPVTASDKAHLEQVNKQRAYLKQSPKTTLTCGASPSAEYSKEWYRTGGNYNKAPVGSGNKKIQQMKAVSIARANPDKLYDKYGKEIQRVVYNKDAGTSTGSVKIYASKADLKQARIDAAKALKDAEAIRNAYKPVEALNRKVIDPVQMKSGTAGTGEDKVTVQTREIIKNKKGEVTDIKILAASGTAKEYFKASQLAKANGKAALTGFGVSGIVGFNAEGQPVINAEQASFKDVQDFKTVNQIAQDVARTNEDAIRARARAEALKVNPNGSEEYLRGVENVAVRANRSTWENIKAGSNHARTQASKAVSSILPDLDTIAKTRDKYLSNVSVKVTQPGKKTREYTLKDVQRKHQKAVKDNAVTAGLLKFTEDEYKYVRNDPLKYAAETGVIMAGGAAFGAGAAGLKAIVNPRLTKVAGKVVGKHGVDVALIGAPVAIGGASAIQYFNSEDYNALSGIEKETAQVQMIAGGFRTLKDFAIAAPGFKAGSKAMEGTISKVKAMRATPSTVKINKPSGLENALPSEFDITNVARNAPKARPRTVTDKVVSLKRQVSKLEAKGKVSDKPKIREIKQQIRAIENKEKNASTVKNLKPLSRSEIKDIANTQSMNKDLADLREMNIFANEYMSGVKPDKGYIGTLKYTPPHSKAPVTEDIVGFSFPKTRKVFKASSTRYDFSRDITGDLKPTVSDIAKVTKATAKQGKNSIEEFMTPKYRAKSPEKFEPSRNSKVSSTELRKKLKLRREAEKIEEGLEKARVEGKVRTEAYYTTKAAAFRGRHGISTEKASKLLRIKKVSDKSLGQKRASYSRFKKAYTSKKKALQDKNSVKAPSDITDIKAHRQAFENSPKGKEATRQQRREELKQLLKEAQKIKDFERSSKDITDIVSARRTALNPRSKATLSDVGRMKLNNKKSTKRIKPTTKPTIKPEEIDEGIGFRVMPLGKTQTKQLKGVRTRRKLINEKSGKTPHFRDAQFETFAAKSRRKQRNEGKQLVKDLEEDYLQSIEQKYLKSTQSKPDKKAPSNVSVSTKSGTLKLIMRTETVEKPVEVVRFKQKLLQEKLKTRSKIIKTKQRSKTKAVSEKARSVKVFRSLYLPIEITDNKERVKSLPVVPSTIAGFRSIKQVEQVINSIGTTLKTLPDVPTKPRIKEITRTHDTKVPSVKPYTIIHEKVRSGQSLPEVPVTVVKSATITPEKVDPVIKNIIKEVTVITGITSTPQSFKVDPVVVQKHVVPPGRKPQKQITKGKDPKGAAKYQRKIQNAFGNLETMFGKSTAKPIRKTIKKAVKRVQRA
ncbi:hypothetical protein EQO05_00965 [Methanosarcina sp. MSH10X1]|uniref:hypothetical protein n=1 Tax=Methanosarcina sp. MSH10X1 TaxID=2507075 RepID=UPI000FFC7D0A|nr:hypothetical protein [Methanosarcina sp. MSH10X1]RXA21839.1 hypothetical protein EQO05_00965 [Methanosarcina sp. MSH10X1]